MLSAIKLDQVTYRFFRKTNQINNFKKGNRSNKSIKLYQSYKKTIFGCIELIYEHFWNVHMPTNRIN